ncbi:MAG: hypothetical protein ACT4O2_13000, partial [Beijerinckiaceae bacterium]
MTQTTNCPVCEEAGCSILPKDGSFPNSSYNCARCGKFMLWGTLANGFGNSYLTAPRRAILSHQLCRRQRPDGNPVEIVEDELPEFQLDEPLPNPAEQADNLILWIGDRKLPPAEYVKVPVPEVSAWIGAAITPNDPSSTLKWLLDQDAVKCLVERYSSGFVDPMEPMKPLELRLNMAGWQRYEALKHAQVESRTAFMAMKFDSELDLLVGYFKRAVALTGFELRVLTDGQPAGLIDDQLRVRLRTARFVIADLTHGNQGAYWESGFAEGLGRPVIYTCREEEWKERKTHFDTNHLNTIIWNPADLGTAATRLTLTIRANLP